MPITNNHNLPLELAVWVLYDDYDFYSETNYASATGLMKPLRQIVLSPRIAAKNKLVLDVENLVPSALGKAIHAGIQRAWENGNYRRALAELGHSQETIDRVLVNPTTEQLAAAKDPIPVYVEQRSIRTLTVGGVQFKVGGKFDMVCDGRITDTKTTTVFSWITGNKDDDYRLQMSIYRWLNPDKVTDEYGRINFVFTDWSKLDAKRRSDYPQKRLMSRDILLMSTEETEAWIRTKIQLVLDHQDTPEHLLPECSDEELWISAPTFKYYANPATAEAGGRSTRNFETLEEAHKYMVERGKGTIKMVKGVPRRCGYCNAFSACTQKDRYDHD